MFATHWADLFVNSVLFCMDHCCHLWVSDLMRSALDSTMSPMLASPMLARPDTLTLPAEWILSRDGAAHAVAKRSASAGRGPSLLSEVYQSTHPINQCMRLVAAMPKAKLAETC